MHGNLGFVLLSFDSNIICYGGYIITEAGKSLQDTNPLIHREKYYIYDSGCVRKPFDGSAHRFLSRCLYLSLTYADVLIIF